MFRFHAISLPLSLLVCNIASAQQASQTQPPAADAVVAVPTDLSLDATEIYKLVLAGAYQMANDFPSEKTEADLNGLSREGTLLTSNESMPLVNPGQPCQEPATPDPNFVPKSTEDYWMYKFGDWHIAHPANQEAKYQTLMVEYRKLCHTRWDLAALLGDEVPNLLITPKKKPEPEAPKQPAEPPKPEKAGTGRALIVPSMPIVKAVPIQMGQFTYADVSPIVFSPDHSIALVFLHIKGRGDIAMWEGFVRIDGKWKFAPEWSRQITTHD